MKNSQNLILFGREICPLCDTAAALLDATGVPWIERYIDDDVGLLVRYRSRIPVLFDERSGRELPWPFDRTQLKAFVDEL